MIEAGLAQYLDNQEVLTFDETGTSGDVFINVLPSNPDKAVGIFSQGGSAPSPKFVEQTTDLQFLVRGDADPRPAENLAQSIFNHLHGLTQEDLPDGTYLLQSRAMQGKPIHIGRDDSGRHKFSVNFRLRYEAETMHRPENY